MNDIVERSLRLWHDRPCRRYVKIFGAMATKQDEQPGRGRGRPSAFDRTEAVNRAMKLFWEHGYEGTSFDQLVQAMRISPSSFYNRPSGCMISLAGMPELAAFYNSVTRGMAVQARDGGGTQHKKPRG